MNSPICNEWVGEERKKAADIEIEKAKEATLEAFLNNQ